MRRLLIAEDEELFRRELVHTIPWEDFGFALIGAAEDGLCALRLIRERSPELVLCDIRMPGLDGIELLKRVADDEPSVSPPLFIFLSGHADFSYAREALRYGAVDYLVKPVGDDELAAALGKARAALDSRELALGSELSALLPRLDAPGGPGARGDGPVEAACGIIAERLASDLSLESVASSVGLSGDHLSRLFKRATGLSFAEYLAAARIRRAAELLADPTIRIGDVADLSGYADQRYFSTVFRRLVGLTPSEYRRRRLGG